MARAFINKNHRWDGGPLCLLVSLGFTLLYFTLMWPYPFALLDASGPWAPSDRHRGASASSRPLAHLHRRLRTYRLCPLCWHTRRAAGTTARTTAASGCRFVASDAPAGPADATVQLVIPKLEAAPLARRRSVAWFDRNFAGAANRLVVEVQQHIVGDPYDRSLWGTWEIARSRYEWLRRAGRAGQYEGAEACVSVKYRVFFALFCSRRSICRSISTRTHA